MITVRETSTRQDKLLDSAQSKLFLLRECFFDISIVPLCL